MTAFSQSWPAPAKLNLMLRIVGRRADGYHLLQTVFRFIDYGDALQFRVREDGVIARVNEISGIVAEDDLCVRAARALQQVSGTPLGADIHLDKRLPLGGGLGGGSSDAATTLLALNQLWHTGLTRAQLLELALKLGADVPVFVFGDNAFAEGIGEVLQPITLTPAWYVVLCPPVAVSTARIFAHPELKRDSKKVTIQSFSAGKLGSWLANSINDLESLVCREYPDIERHLTWLRRHGERSSAVMMTGSGACVFAAFGNMDDAVQVVEQLPPDMRGFVARGLEQHPLRELAQ